MGYHISTDGGGTKLAAILFDDDLNLIRHGISGPTNTNFSPMETVRANIADCLSQAIGEASRVDTLYICIVGPSEVMVEEAQRRTEIGHFEDVVEGRMSLMAGAGVDCGILAQAGTGSDIFILLPDGSHVVIGGWGSILGDEGSGYDIGLRGLRSAIYAFDGRGPHTEILPLLREEWGIGDNLFDMVTPIYADPQLRRRVASAARVVAKAAHLGDKIALDIYRAAAEELAHMTKAALKKCTLPIEGPVVAGGSAWKGHPIMFETYRARLADILPGRPFLMPAFEPVMGGVVRVALDQGRKPEEFMPLLRERFPQFIYQ